MALVAAAMAGATITARPAAAASSCSDIAMNAVNTTNNNLYRWTTTTPMAPSWTSAQQVGSNWSSVRLLAQEGPWASQSWADAGKHKLYAVNQSGDLLLYLWSGSAWTGGAAIGHGWGNFTRILAAGGGVIYAVHSDGRLLWYRYTGAGWQGSGQEYGSGSQIGTGWNNLSKVFGGGNGIIYGVRPNGDLVWYKHKTPGKGISRWAGPLIVGSGWSSVREPVSGGDGLIYGINASQQLVLYNHTGAATGANTWANSGVGRIIGSGWGSYNRLVVNPQTCVSKPTRQDSWDRAVYFVHGFDPGALTTNNPSIDCQVNFGPAINRFKARGYTGPLWTMGFYGADTNCTAKVINGDLNTSLTEVARKTAWYLYDTHSLWGEPVDLIGHSMGGLVIRAAISGTWDRWSVGGQPFPPYIDVEDAVTLAAPHLGSSLTGFGPYQQFVQMGSASTFLSLLPPNPQSRIGTDWTAIGSTINGVADPYISYWSSLGYQSGVIKDIGRLNAGHQALFSGYNHSGIRDAGAVGAQDQSVTYWDWTGTSHYAGSQSATSSAMPSAGWRTTAGYRPLDWAYMSIVNWQSW